VQGVDAIPKPNRVHQPIRVPVEVFHGLEHTSPTESLQRDCIRVLASELRYVQCVPKPRRAGAGNSARSSRHDPTQTTALRQGSSMGSIC
jgi:hypothetical protein